MLTILLCLASVIVIQRLSELYLAERNRAHALSRGGKEFGREHYRAFVLLHSAWIVAWCVEGWYSVHDSELWKHSYTLESICSYICGLLFLAAQVLRYWAIVSLGYAWNTRVIVVPGEERVCAGPYRYWKHPNYLAVAIEIAAVPMIVFAWKTAIVASLVNAVLLLAIRIPIEERALQELK